MDDAVPDDVDDDQLEDMIRDVGTESFAEARGYVCMSSDAETPLYPRSTNFTRLSSMLRLMNLKAINGWTDKSFTELRQLLCFQREILYLIVIMRPKRFFVQCVWNIKRYMHVLMIVYYTGKNLNC